MARGKGASRIIGAMTQANNNLENCSPAE